MNKLPLLASALFLTTSLSAVTLEMSVESNGELLMAPTIDAILNEPGIVTLLDDEQNGYTLEVLATQQEEDEEHLLIECELSRIEGDSSQTIVRPSITTEMGEKATIAVGEDNRLLSISVTPKVSHKKARRTSRG